METITTTTILLNQGISISQGYLGGMLLAILILFYLVYALTKPEKF